MYLSVWPLQLCYHDLFRMGFSKDFSNASGQSGNRRIRWRWLALSVRLNCPYKQSGNYQSPRSEPMTSHVAGCQEIPF